MSWREEITAAVRAYLRETAQVNRDLGKLIGMTSQGVGYKLRKHSWTVDDVEALARVGVTVPWPAQGASRVPGHKLVARLEGQEQAARTITRAIKAGPVAMTLTASDMAVVLATVEAIEASISAQLNILAKKKKVKSDV